MTLMLTHLTNIFVIYLLSLKQPNNDLSHEVLWETKIMRTKLDIIMKQVDAQAVLLKNKFHSKSLESEITDDPFRFARDDFALPEPTPGFQAPLVIGKVIDYDPINQLEPKSVYDSENEDNDIYPSPSSPIQSEDYIAPRITPEGNFNNEELNLHEERCELSQKGCRKLHEDISQQEDEAAKSLLLATREKHRDKHNNATTSESFPIRQCSLSFCTQDGHLSLYRDLDKYFATKAVYPLTVARLHESHEWAAISQAYGKKLPPPPSQQGCGMAVLVASMDYSGAEWQVALLRLIFRWLDLPHPPQNYMYWNMHAHVGGHFTQNLTHDGSFDYLTAYHEWGSNLTSDDHVIIRTPYADDDEAQELCKDSIVIAGHRSLLDLGLLYLVQYADSAQSIMSLWQSMIIYLKTVVLHQRRWNSIANIMVPLYLFYDFNVQGMEEQKQILQRGIKIFARDVCLLLLRKTNTKQRCTDPAELDKLWRLVNRDADLLSEAESLFDQQKQVLVAHKRALIDPDWQRILLSLEQTFRSWQETMGY